MTVNQVKRLKMQYRGIRGQVALPPFSFVPG